MPRRSNKNAGGSDASPPPPHRHRPQAGEDKEEDEEIFTNWPDDGEAEEAAAEQRTLLAPLESQHRDTAYRLFMVAERRAVAERVAEAQAVARAASHRRNVQAARAAMAASEQRLTSRFEGVALAAVAEA
jgi:hypothetical protein